MISHEARDPTQPSPEDITKKRKHEDDSQDEFTTKPFELPAPETGFQHDLESSNQVYPVSRPNEALSGGLTSKFHEETGRNNKRLKKIPKSNSDNYPTITFSGECKLQSQIRIRDLQSLALYILADGESPQFVSVRNRPQIRKVVIIMVPGLELSMFTDSDIRDNSSVYSPSGYYPIKLQSDKLTENLKQFATMFDYVWPVKTPGDDKNMKMYSPLQAMLIAPIPKSKEENQTQKKKGPSVVKEPEGWKDQRVLIAELLHSPEELVENEYTLHPASYKTEAEKLSLLEYRRSVGTSTNDGWLDTHVAILDDDARPESGNLITEDSLVGDWKVLAMDCEMCMTGESNFSLTRISIVSWDGSVLMDELVKPAEPITNYLTQYSGITENILKNVTTTLSDIQEKLLKIIHSHTILIGHSLNSDLTALKITHPHIVDTAIIFPHPRGPPLKSSLKFLAQRYLNREIQKGHGATGPGAGHDSIEDARTCLDLVKQKCEKGKAWGTFEAYGESIFKRVARTGKRFKCQQSLPTAQSSAGRTSAAVDWGDPRKGPGAAADFPISCKNDDEVMQGVIRAVTGDPDGKEIPGGGVDFVWARFRELEALRGWSNNNRRATIGAPGSDQLTPDIAIKSDEQTSVSATTAVSEAMDLPLSALTKPSARAIAEMTQRIFDIYSALPPCTAVILYSGSGCPLEMSRLQALHTTFKREYKTKKWDQLSVRWTDVEEQALRRASLVARHGLGFVGVK